MKATLLFLLFIARQTSALHQVSVTITPSRSQYFEYEKMLKLSRCAVGWGDQISSNCDVKAVKLSDSGVYWCESKHGDSSQTVNITVTDDSAPATLTASPNSSQLFEYKKLSLSCGDNSTSQGWKIFRATSSNAKSVGKMSSCGENWGVPDSFGCVLHAAKQDDSAIYWCESPERRRSNSLNIAFHERNQLVSMEMSPLSEDDEARAREYDDVTTVHHF
ncbi:hypothetical protein FQN60_006705 [Etheostoma spectabile]|uniref:Ig-like domain-containing protein n=1 Tax=Etheostoma spectabile TaxID=54343 RepID=A0A5J5CCY4_9PERO|nr:hypothetical protein FQN60_006705 [Etheostoma spectabile]